MKQLYQPNNMLTIGQDKKISCHKMVKTRSSKAWQKNGITPWLAYPLFLCAGTFSHTLLLNTKSHYTASQRYRRIWNWSGFPVLTVHPLCFYQLANRFAWHGFKYSIRCNYKQTIFCKRTCSTNARFIIVELIWYTYTFLANCQIAIYKERHANIHWCPPLLVLCLTMISGLAIKPLPW